MKSTIVYYSYSGNTRQVAWILYEHLIQKGNVQIAELKASDESKSFFGQAHRALRHVKAQIEPVALDFLEYDVVCLGTPVWAFGPAPAMNAYLQKCFNADGKKAVLFTTFGSGTGNERCLNYMQALLSKKGVKEFKRFSIQQSKVNDKEFVLAKIKEAAGF